MFELDPIITDKHFTLTLSRLTGRLCPSTAMDAIKKKMQAMKVEKDNAMDRADACEQAAKDAKIRNSRRWFILQSSCRILIIQDNHWLWVVLSQIKGSHWLIYVLGYE
jgi:hypothetical protein